MENLTPEDIEIMKEAISRYEGSNPDEAADVASDAAQDRKMLEALVSALEIVIDEVENLRHCVDDLEHKVNDEIIGGVTNLYNENLRLDGIAGLKAKYGEQIGPFEGVFQALADDPNADIYSKLYDKLQELKSGEGYTEESEGKYVSDLLERLKAAAPKPAAVEVVQVEKSVEPSEEEALTAKIRAMKKKASSAGSY